MISFEVSFESLLISIEVLFNFDSHIPIYLFDGNQFTEFLLEFIFLNDHFSSNLSNRLNTTPLLLGGC